MATEIRRLLDLDDDQPLPVDLRPLLEAGRFSMAEIDLAADQGGHEAMIFPGPDGLLHIRVDPRPRDPDGYDASDDLRAEVHRQRVRFRVAHEIAHSFFYERDGERARRRRRSSPGEEAFCDRFASALLLPPAAVRGMEPSANSVLELQCRFDVSTQVAARAFADQFPDLDVLLGYWSREASSLRPQWASEGIEANADEALAAAAGESDVRWFELSLAVARRPRRQWIAVGRYAPPFAD